MKDERQKTCNVEQTTFIVDDLRQNQIKCSPPKFEFATTVSWLTVMNKIMNNGVERKHSIPADRMMLILHRLPAELFTSGHFLRPFPKMGEHDFELGSGNIVDNPLPLQTLAFLGMMGVERTVNLLSSCPPKEAFLKAIDANSGGGGASKAYIYSFMEEDFFCACFGIYTTFFGDTYIFSPVSGEYFFDSEACRPREFSDRVEMICNNLSKKHTNALCDIREVVFKEKADRSKMY